MARPPRIDFPDALYHVTSRGNGRADIFWSDDDRHRFLQQLRDNVQTAAVRLYAFVLMDNHFHLLVRTPRDRSRFMQRLAPPTPSTAATSTTSRGINSKAGSRPSWSRTRPICSP